MKIQILYPMAFYVFYIWALLVSGFVVRKRSIDLKEMSIKYFKTYADPSSTPEKVQVYTRHVDNQFQAPPIFLITCLVYLAAPVSAAWGIYLAWAYVGTRVLHSFIHLGSNNVIHRAGLYGLGWLLILSMWIEILLTVKEPAAGFLDGLF